MDRNHMHNLTGEKYKWEWCFTLTHCPSVCDCGFDGCDAKVDTEKWEGWV